MPRAPRPAPLHVVLLAGGSGTRFWPASRSARPKQFLALASTAPLLVETWRRARRLVPPSRLWVVAPVALARRVARTLPRLAPGRLIVEPAPRDTAPAIALAAVHVARAAPDAIMAVLPTDHVVRDVARFERALGAAARAASGGALVCLGVRPDRPATGFGYLRCASAPRGLAPIVVERFVEKPDPARARRFVRSGRYLWNGGMFVWRAARFLDELERTAPGIRRAVQQHVAGRRGAWGRAERKSVDYAVMEHAHDVRVVPLDAGWDDVGSWDAAARLAVPVPDGPNAPVVLDSPGSFVYGATRAVALVGLPDVVVVDSPDALLVVRRGQTERVKEVVDALRRRGRHELL